MFNLAGGLQQDCNGVGQDVARAVELFQRAIDEGVHLDLMHNLASLLQDGGNGVGQDVAGAVQLYQCAIDECELISSMFNLALLLWTGARSLTRDLPRCKSLLEYCVEYGSGNDYKFFWGHFLLYESDFRNASAAMTVFGRNCQSQ